MRVAAFDLASNVGWAVDGVENACPPRSGVYAMPPVTDRRYGRSFLNFEDWLVRFIKQQQPQLVAYEAPIAPHGNDDAFWRRRPRGEGQRKLIFTDHIARILFGLVTLTETVAEAMGCQVQSVSMFDARKYLVGNRTPENAKQAVFDRCRMLRWPVETLDASDACAVWCFAKAHNDRSFRLDTGPLFAGRV